MPKVNKVYVWKRIPRLPIAYQEVEYIQSSGTQYIDTLYIPSVNTEIVTDMQWGTQSVQWAEFFWVAAGNASNNWISWRIYRGTATNFNPWFCNSTYWEAQITTTINTWHNIVLKSWSCTLDWTSHTITTTSTPYQSSIDLFACNSWWTHWWRASKCSIKTFKIYESWTLMRDFVPCYRKSDDEIWLYDLVNDQFYTNGWSGTFIKWGDVDNTIYKEFQVRPK